MSYTGQGTRDVMLNEAHVSWPEISEEACIVRYKGQETRRVMPWVLEVMHVQSGVQDIGLCRVMLTNTGVSRESGTRRYCIQGSQEAMHIVCIFFYRYEKNTCCCHSRCLSVRLYVRRLSNFNMGSNMLFCVVSRYIV